MRLPKKERPSYRKAPVILIYAQSEAVNGRACCIEYRYLSPTIAVHIARVQRILQSNSHSRMSHQSVITPAEYGVNLTAFDQLQHLQEFRAIGSLE